ncbi:hypothetical protein B0D78_09580 [Pyramidobacter sp. C12-8]|nr:hypothetical protein B0D78_09580 [Pyramidobacter sp. C12-8]
MPLRGGTAFFASPDVFPAGFVVFFLADAELAEAPAVVFFPEATALFVAAAPVFLFETVFAAVFRVFAVGAMMLSFQ